MTVLVTPDEMFAAEQATIAAGTSAEVLMRRAAEAIADWLDRHVASRTASARNIVGLVGPGNNGGDALVTLGILSTKGWRCRALLVHRDGIGELPMSDAERSGIATTTELNLEGADVILDGVFGFRSRPSLPPSVAALCKQVAATRTARPVLVVAVDVPSGIDARSGSADADALRADVTLCLGLPKLGLTHEPAATLTGELVTIDIGIAPPALPTDRPRLLDAETVVSLLPRRKASAHKHGAGAVLIVGGAPTYYGAPRLSAEAAQRAGAGLVAAAVPEPVVPVLAAQVPETVVVPLEPSGQVRAIERFVSERGASLRAMVVGPGLGRSDVATALLAGLLAEQAPEAVRRLTKVVDADALNWMSDLDGPPSGLIAGSAVLTPHPGELGRLLGIDTADVLSDPVGHARRAAAHFRQIVILKSGCSPVAHPDGAVWLAQRSTPELATAGTGDVLSGLVGGLLAQGMTPWDAARAGVFAGAIAGKRAATFHGTLGTVARDVIDAIGGVLRDLSEPAVTT